MTKRLKGLTSAIISPFFLISLTVAVCAEREPSDSFAFSVPIINNFSFDVPEEAGADTSYYEEMENALIEKHERYETFKRSRASYPATVDLKATWQQQKNSYYCGPATATVILNTMGYIHATQDILAGPDYLRTTTDGTPWYSGTTQTTPYYFNMVHGLNTYHANNHNIYVDGWYYEVCNNGHEDEYIDNMMYTLSEGYAVPLHGKNTSGKLKSYLRYYSRCGHWLVLEGYRSSGGDFYVLDPASGINGFEDVAKKYIAPKSEVLDFINMGIIW